MTEEAKMETYLVFCEWKSKGYYLIKTDEGIERAVISAYEQSDLPPTEHTEVINESFEVLDVVEAENSGVLENLNSVLNKEFS